MLFSLDNKSINLLKKGNNIIKKLQVYINELIKYDSFTKKENNKM